MSVNLHQLDQIQDYDQAIAALDEFVEQLVREFVASVEGKTYLKAHPVMTEYVGSWIDHLLYFGYAYESVTLPNMTMGNIEVIVTQIFPHKISLLDPEEAITTIPELKAFWQFLKREYQLPQAHRIVKFLKQLEPKFPSMMMDPSNFGMAKSWLMSGLAAGFDMTTEEGIKQFQQLHNQELATAAQGKGLSNINDLGMEGSDLLSPREQVALENMLQDLAIEVLQEFPLEVPAAKEFQRQLEATITPRIAQKTSNKSQPEITILQQQEISETIPGVYIFKVSWHQIWRRIAISSQMTLWDLSQLILQSVDFDCDHLDMFSYRNQLGITMRIVHPYMDESPSTDEIKIADLPLGIGSIMEYLFDFGDNWEFQLQLEEIKSDDLRPDYGEVIASKGKAPEQYPNWDEY